MKKNVLIICMLLTSYSYSQCNGGRYSAEIFNNVSVDENVIYGNNIDYNLQNIQLDMDVYEGLGDNETLRPLIVLVHGGDFLNGSKTDSDVLEYSTRFSKMGYVCAAINYRKGYFPINEINYTKAMIRAVQDTRGAVKYFKNDAAGINNYKIDTNKIFVLGIEAGAVASYNYAYLDKVCELGEVISSQDLNNLGGFEGTTTNSIYTSKISGIISIGGGISTRGLIESSDISFCAIQGTDDSKYPFIRGDYYALGVLLGIMDGLTNIEAYSSTFVGTNLADNMRTFPFVGSGTFPHLESTQNMDISVNVIMNYLLNIMGCQEVAPITSDFKEEEDIYVLKVCNLGINVIDDNALVVYPNPTDGIISISGINENEISNVVVESLNGEVIYNTKHLNLNLEKNSPGVYFLKINLINGGNVIKRISVY